jgi:hypothetical protein
MNPKSTFVLVIRDEGSFLPTDIRLRHLLKRLLRQLAFRCESITPVSEITPNAQCSDTPTGIEQLRTLRRELENQKREP